MKKHSHKPTDFFSDYHIVQVKKFCLSGSIAVCAAVSLVSLIHSDIDPRGLMASVANVTSSTRYDADIVMTRATEHIILTLGTRASSVDRINLTLLGDPTRLRGIATTDADIAISSQPDMGVYKISIDGHGRDIPAGTRIADLIGDMESSAPLTLSDTEFVSGGMRYSLSNQGE